MSDIYKVNCPHCGNSITTQCTYWQSVGLFETASYKCVKCSNHFYTVYNKVINHMETMKGD